MIQVDVAPCFDAAAIAGVVNEVWRNQYPDEKKLVRWPAEFFEWHFLNAPENHPAVCLGAKVDGELVGIFCADIWPVTMADGQMEYVSFLSCVSVKPIRARYHVSAALLQAAQDWSEAKGARQFFGYVNPAESDLAGRRYWTSRKGFDHVFVGGSRQWYLSAAGLDSLPVADIDLPDSSTNAIAKRLLEEWRARPANDQVARLIWSEARLAHQLGYGDIARCASAIDDESYAICSFYALPQEGGDGVGYIDFLASSSLQNPRMRQVLADAVGHLRARGCSRIFSAGSPANDDTLLKALGFVPCFPSYAPLVASWGGSPTFTQQTQISAFYR